MENIGFSLVFRLPAASRAGRPRSGSFQCPRSGFHGFQCWHPARSPSHSSPRSGIRDIRVDNPPPERVLVREAVFSSFL